MPTAEELILFVMSTPTWKNLCRTAATGPMPPYLIVVCDLNTDVGIAVAEALNPQDYKRRAVGEDVWTFALPVEVWQRFREQLSGSRDVFLGPEQGQAFASVTTHQVITGRVVDVGGQDNNSPRNPSNTPMVCSFGAGKTFRSIPRPRNFHRN